MAIRVAYDLVPARIATGGIRRYAQELGTALGARSDVTLLPAGPRARSRILRRHRIAQGLTREAWHHMLGLDRRASRDGAELIHCPAAFVPEHVRLPLVITIHDVLPLRHPQLFPRVIVYHQRLLLARRTRRAARIIANTEHARREIIESLQVEPGRIEVVPCGVAERFQPRTVDAPWLRTRFAIDRPYVLCVGTLEPRKNLLGVLRAMRAARLEDDVSLVVVGGRGWRNEAFEREASRAEIPLVLTGAIPDAELVALYSAARCLVFPSLYEGFGLPVLEAMACGCPVVTSDRSGLPELVDRAGLVVDPLDPERIGEAVRRLCEDQPLRDGLRKAGLRRAAQRSWDRVAHQTVGVYRRALLEGSGDRPCAS